jgi:hypothetical protein
VERAAHDPEVDWVDRRGRDRDPDLIGSRLDDGDVDDLDRVGAARRADDRCTEGGSTQGSAPRLGLLFEVVYLIIEGLLSIGK